MFWKLTKQVHINVYGLFKKNDPIVWHKWPKLKLMSYWILRTHISPSLLIYHRFVKEIKKKLFFNISLMAFDLYFCNTNNISQQDYNTSNSKNYCTLLIYCYNEVQKLIFDHF